MRIVIATTQTPFVRGEGELQAAALAEALRGAGHEAAIVAIPFNPYPPERILDQMLACRMLDLGTSGPEPADRMIGLDFPAYLIPHPHKVLWLLHQHRPAYDGWDDGTSGLAHEPNGAQIRAVIRDADRNVIPEARARYAVSRAAASRLQAGCGITAAPLYHPPPDAGRFRAGDYGDYFLVPGPIDSAGRQFLVLEALEQTREPVRLCFIGAAEGPRAACKFRERLAASAATNRVVWREDATPERKIADYADCRAVVLAPLAADYGYGTLEAMLANKAVITCGDSGAPLEFVRDGETGLVCRRDAVALAEAMDKLWVDRDRAAMLGRAAGRHYRELKISWEHAISCLLV